MLFNKVIVFICTLGIIYILIFPQRCMTASIYGAEIFFKSVFPALFPFLVLTNLLFLYDGINIYSKIFGNILCKPLKLPKEASVVLIISFLCGYPLGAKYSFDLYNKGIIDYYDFNRLASIASNSSPIFMIGTIGTAIYGNPLLGYILLGGNLLSCIAMGLILPGRKSNLYSKKISRKISIVKIDFSNALKDSITLAFETILVILGFIVIFSIIITMLRDSFIFSNLQATKLKLLLPIIYGSIELTNGCFLIANTSFNMFAQIIIIAFLLGFGGLSITMQVYSFIGKSKLPMKIYMKRKLLQGVIASIITGLLYFIVSSLIGIS
ncbi:MAG TPA: sporulation integral membrane protein YlbJ [Clostridiaceae bacterium]